MKKFNIILAFLLSFNISAQHTGILKPDGRIFKSDISLNENFIKDNKLIFNSSVAFSDINSAAFDTLRYFDFISLPGKKYSLAGQDWLVQWFEAPGDLYLKGMGFSCAGNKDSLTVEVKVVKLNWKKEDLLNQAISCYGYYEADGNGYNNATAFLDNPDRTGNWISAQPDVPEPFGEDIWSDSGRGMIILPIGNDSIPEYHWMSLSGELGVQAGDIFGIAIKNSGPILDSNKIWFWSDNNPGYRGWKFYANGKSEPGIDFGWWTTDYTFDFAVIVDWASYPIFYFYHTPIRTTLNTDPIPIKVTVIGPNEHPYFVSMIYSTDNGMTWQEIMMNYIGNTEYEVTVPGFQPGAEVSYFFWASDPSDSNYYGKSLIYSYRIFKKQGDVLFIYNSSDFSTNIAKRLYIGNPEVGNSYIVDPVPNDVWLSSYGTAEAADVMNLYNWVVQIDGSYPDVDFSEAAKIYLEGATSTNPRAYFLSSQDYGCRLNSTCADTAFVKGDFQYDYLGIGLLGPQDLTLDTGAKVEIQPVSSDPLSDWIADYNTANEVTYWFGPWYELKFTGYIDGITPTPSAQTTFTSGSHTVGIRNEGPDWKTSFITFDYAGSNFRSDTSLTPEIDPKYIWGIEVGNQALKFLQWAGYNPTNVEEPAENSPDEFKLFQNYPNPFNPVTTIRYSIPNVETRHASSLQNVTLKVYDTLGREVKTLFNKEQLSGSYEILFDASSLTSGIYFYELRAGQFSSVRKMILLK